MSNKLPDQLKIVKLTAENFKRLKAVEIVPDPDGSIVLITGRNAQGKSSVLDSIMAALLGNKAAPEEPIRKGAVKSRIVVDLGDIIVERSFTQKGGELKVKSGAGLTYPSPQSLLDSLIGKLAFDPLVFAKLPARAQLDQLLQVVDLGFDPAELAEQRKALYDERTLAGREVKRLTGALESMPRPECADTEEVSLAELAAQHGERQRANQARQQSIYSAEQMQRKQHEMVSEQEDLRTKIAALQEQLTNLEAATAEQAQLYTECLAMANAMPHYDLADIEARMQTAEQHNAAVRQARDYHAKHRELAAAQQQHDALDSRIAALDAQKASALASAAMPVPGLGITEDGLTLNGIPLQQASSSEQLRVSVAISMELNPTLRVLTIRDGSLLDSEGLRIIAEQARGKGYQAWIEQVDETGEVGIVIEDGCVRAETPELALEVERGS